MPLRRTLSEVEEIWKGLKVTKEGKALGEKVLGRKVEVGVDQQVCS